MVQISLSINTGPLTWLGNDGAWKRFGPYEPRENQEGPLYKIQNVSKRTMSMRILHYVTSRKSTFRNRE